MKNANPSSSTSNSEFLDLNKKIKIESWLEDSRIVDSSVGSDELEYFDTFPILEELEYHERLLKYPNPSWVDAKIIIKNLNNIKISCMIGHFLKRQAYIDLESPINVMSKQHYKRIMNKGLESRQKPSNSSKNNNFVGRVRGLKVFIGNLTYESLGWHLEEVHVTWAHLEKKRTRLRTCTNIHQEVLFSERGDGAAGIKRRRHDLSGDGVWILATMSQRSRLKVNLEPSTRKPAFVCIAVDTSRETRPGIYGSHVVCMGKAGKRFAFVRFIKVFNLDRLVENLCTIWIGRYHLYANSVRFERSHKSFSAPTANAAEVPKKSFVPQYSNARPGSYANVVNGAAWSRETFKKIGKKWGETLNLEDNVDTSFGCKRLCVKTAHPNPSFIDNKENNYASEEESDFVPNNNDPNNHINEEVFGDVYGSDDDGVP
nr:protein kinase-like domain, concanavalin A-like lectin/glucanase domain protein [Tanacetum cinerariifolium]